MRAPSKAQKQAITHLSGPALVCAGPGSGKTFTIIQRILYLINFHQVQPDNILVITFTRAAAKEMQERFARESSRQGVSFGTFHSICFHILCQCREAESESLITDKDKRTLFQILLGNLGFTEKCDGQILTALQTLIGRLKNLPENAGTKEREELLERDAGLSLLFSMEEVMQIWEAYDTHLRENGLLDFDDMVTKCVELFRQKPEICERYRKRFLYILVDEFQDVNDPQYQFLKLLWEPGTQLFAVGDDDQAIYGFRGASTGIMERFQEDFSECTTIMLTENYRSKSEIVSFSARLIGQNKERFYKIFHPMQTGGRVSLTCFETRKEEEDALIRALSGLDAAAISHAAVILRTNREVYQYAALFQSNNIPVKGMKKVWNNLAHGFVLEDIKAFLSYLYNGHRRKDLICFMNKPNRFFSRSALTGEQVTAGQFEDYYRKNGEMLGRSRQFLRQLIIAETLSPALAVSFFRKSMGYDVYLTGRAETERERKQLYEQAEQIQSWFEAYRPGSSLEEFVRLHEDNLKETKEKGKKPGVSVLTMHGAKGLEFEQVYLPDVNEGVIPGREVKTPEEHEEERRLLYVAVTRAKSDLFIFYTKERNRKLSRYLEGIIPHP